MRVGEYLIFYFLMLFFYFIFYCLMSMNFVQANFELHHVTVGVNEYCLAAHEGISSIPRCYFILTLSAGDPAECASPEINYAYTRAPIFLVSSRKAIYALLPSVFAYIVFKFSSLQGKLTCGLWDIILFLL